MCITRRHHEHRASHIHTSEVVDMMNFTAKISYKQNREFIGTEKINSEKGKKWNSIDTACCRSSMYTSHH